MGTVRPYDGQSRVMAEIGSLMKQNPNPEYIRKNLSESAKKKLERIFREKRIRDTLRIISLLNSRGMDFVVLKGITLSYFDRGRDFVDLDILVDRKDVEAVGGLLAREFGYHYARPEELRSLARGDDNRHDVSLHHSHMLPVEVHYKLFNYMPDEGLHLLSDKAFLDMDGVRIPCLRKELQLLEVLLHNAFHHMFICDREKWAGDINIVVGNNDIDWAGFADLARRINHAEVVYLTAGLLRTFRKAKVRMPDRAMRMLAPPSLVCYLKKPVFAWALYFCRDRLFPPQDILEERFHVPRSSMLFTLCYPANWARLPFAAASLLLRRP